MSERLGYGIQIELLMALEEVRRLEKVLGEEMRQQEEARGDIKEDEWPWRGSAVAVDWMHRVDSAAQDLHTAQSAYIDLAIEQEDQWTRADAQAEGRPSRVRRIEARMQERRDGLKLQEWIRNNDRKEHGDE